MSVNMHTARTLLVASCMALAIFASQRTAAQTLTGSSAAADEQTIRGLVAQFNTGKVPTYTDERIFVSGAFAKPQIGKEVSEEDKARRDKMQKERLNFKQNSRIQRLEVAKAGDMAYEFGLADLSWDTPEKKHIAFESSYLRVWRKVEGEWKVDVFFARPNEEPRER